MVFSCISEMPPNLERTSLAESGLFVMMQVRVSYASSVLVFSAPVFTTAHHDIDQKYICCAKNKHENNTGVQRKKNTL